MTKKLYDPVKERPVGPGTQLKPTAEMPRPELKDSFRGVTDHKGGDLKRVRPQDKGGK